MSILILGLVLFFGIHILPWQQGLRATLANRLGPRAYPALFSLIALIGLILIIIGKARAEFSALYTPPTWGRSLAIPLMFIALVLVPAANFPNNIKRLVRHPMLIGIIIWSMAHLLANGDVASFILFASFGVYSVIGIISANQRGKNANLAKVPIIKDVIALTIGIIVFSLLLFLHPYLFDVPVII